MDASAMRVGATDFLAKEGLSGALLERTLRYAIAGKKSERALREAAAQNARLLAAIEAASVGVVLTELRDEENFVSYVNPAFSQITGYGREEVVGQTLDLLGGRQTAPELERAVVQSLSEGVATEGTAINFRRDGTPFWNQAHFAPIHQNEDRDAERHIGNVGFFQDVTARIEAENAAHEARRNLEIAQQIARMGSWNYEFSAPGQWTGALGFWSDQTYRILGLEPGALVPSRAAWFECVHPDDRKTASETLDEAMKGAADYALDCRVVQPDGQERFVQTRAQIERDAWGNAVRIHGTFLDVTERERAQRARRELENRFERRHAGRADYSVGRR